MPEDTTKKHVDMPEISSSDSASAASSAEGSDAANVEDMENISLDSDNLLAKSEKMPTQLRQYFHSGELASVRSEVYEKHELSEVDESVCFVTELQIFAGEITVQDFSDILWSRLDWPNEKREDAVQLVADILGYIIMPASAFVGDVIGKLHDLGVDTEQYPKETIEERVMTYDQATKEIVDALELPEMKESDTKRLRHIIETRLRDVRDMAETKRILIKPHKTGGLDMKEDLADKIVGFIEDEMRLTKYVETAFEDERIKQTEGEESVKVYTQEDIREILAGPEEERKELSMRIKKINDSTESDSQELRNKFYDYIYPSSLQVVDGEDVVAALLLLVRRDNLIATLREDTRYQEILEIYFDRKDQSMDEAIKENYASPTALNYFLQIVLRGVAQYGLEDSARYGFRIINILNKRGRDEYLDLVAFDMDKGKFIWTEPIEI